MHRKSGIDILGNVPWGTHFCQFYQTREDLVDILVPYFKAGLENNEFCMWVTSEPLTEEKARESMRKAMPDFDEYLRRGQIEIIPYTGWYLKNDNFDHERALNGWLEKLNYALERGYDGLRLTGNTFWLENYLWRDFADYEEEVNNVIGKYKMLAICTYSLDKFGANEILDVMNTHQFALIKRDGAWKLIESSELREARQALRAETAKRRQAEEALRESEKRFRLLVAGVKDYAIYMLDPYGYVVNWNEGAKNIKGYDAEEIVGKHFSLLYTREDVDAGKPEHELQAALSEGRYEDEGLRVRKDGSIFSASVIISPIMDEDGSLMGFTKIARDITERKNIEETLRESEQRYATTLASIGDAVISTDAEGRITFMNSVAEALTGWTLALALTRPVTDVFNIINEYTRRKADNPVPRVLKEGTITGLANHTVLVRKDGTLVPIGDSGSPIRDRDGKTMGAVLVFRDITGRRRAEEELRKAHDCLETRVQERTADLEEASKASQESEARYRELAESIGEVFYAMDKDLRYTYWNNASEQLTGILAKNAIGKSLFELFPELKGSRAEKLYREVLKTQQPQRFVSKYHVSGKDLFFEINAYPSKFGISIIAKDITERKRAEEQLKESLKEKEVLLKEVHHRVKNNMQVISSLLMLQEDLSEDGKIIEMLKDSQNRISSMALIHERLYRSHNLSKVYLKEYIDDLVSGLFQSYGVSESRVALNINIENVLLGIDSAIPCGLVINELVSNSLKHAFPDDKNGEIKISLRLTDENMIELVVGDNGVGIPEDIDHRKTQSLGLYLVTLLVENQLHGEITLNRDRGAEFLIKFRGVK